MIKVRTHRYENRLSACGYSLKEETDIYDSQLLDIIKDPGWYLDNFDNMTSYRVRWVSYTKESITLPYGMVRETIRRGRDQNGIKSVKFRRKSRKFRKLYK